VVRVSASGELESCSPRAPGRPRSGVAGGAPHRHAGSGVSRHLLRTANRNQVTCGQANRICAPEL